MLPKTIAALNPPAAPAPRLGGSLCVVGAAAAAPAAFALLLARGLGATDSAAACVLALLAAGALARRVAPSDALSWLLGAAAALAAGAWGLPEAGSRLTLGAGAALAAAGALLCRAWRSKISPAGGALAPRWLIWGLGAGACVAWARGAALLLGNSIYAFALVLSAVLAGIGLRRRLESWRGPWRHTPAAAAIAAGLFGLILLHFIRFIGINAGQAERIHLPLMSAWDLLFIAGQLWAALALWTALVSAAAAVDAETQRDWRTTPAAAAAAFAGPLLAAWAVPRWGAASTTAAFSFGALLYAFAAAAAADPRRRPALGITAAILAAAAFLALGLNEPFRDIWHNRLNAAYPGGRFLALRDDGRRSLGLYRFESGAMVVVADGVADHLPEASARRMAHLPLLMISSPRRALLAGSRHPLTAGAVLAHGAAVELIVDHPAALEILDAQQAPSWASVRARIALSSATWRGRLAQNETRFDFILLEPPAPAHGPEAAFETTLEAFSALRASLAPGGLLAVRVPRPYFRETLLRIVKTAQAAFPQVGILDLPGCPLIIASENPVDASPAALLPKLSTEVLIDDILLEEDIKKGLPWLSPIPVDEGIRLQSDDRPLNAFPLAELLRRRPLRADSPIEPVSN